MGDHSKGSGALQDLVLSLSLAYPPPVEAKVFAKGLSLPRLSDTRVTAVLSVGRARPLTVTLKVS